MVKTERLAVVERKMLWRGGVSKIKIPLEARLMEFRNGANALKYFEFHRAVPGGIVKCFVHLKNEADKNCRGSRIKAAVAVMSKTLSDDREYLYVDLVPAHELAPVTHRLAVVPANSKVEEGWETFPTPSPVRGMVVMAPPDAKIDQ